MKLNVLLFAAAREACGLDQVVVEVEQDCAVAQLRTALEGQCKSLRPLLPHAMIAVNSEYVPPDHKLKEMDEIALIPPVSGG